MVAPITAVYVQENEEWMITVIGPNRQLTDHAPGIIAARDRVDQLVEKLAESDTPTVVHLLNGSALEFTATYMAARLTRPEPAPLSETPPKPEPAKTETVEPAAKKTKRPRPTPNLSNDKMAPIADALEKEKPSPAAAEAKPRTTKKAKPPATKS